MSKEKIIYTGEKLFWQLWEDYKCFADRDEETFETWVGSEIDYIQGDKKYQTNSALDDWSEAK